MGFDLHFDMQKLIPQTQLLYVPTTIRNESRQGNKQKPADVLLPLGPQSKGIDASRAERDVIGTDFVHTALSLPYFCKSTQGYARDRTEHCAVYSVL